MKKDKKVIKEKTKLKKRSKTITIVGAGYVGLSFASVLSNIGYVVYILDIDKKKIETVKKGKSHFSEKGIDSLISTGIKKNSLIPTTSKDCLKKSDIVFSCVGTPDLPDGSSNLDFVFGVGDDVAKYCHNSVIFVQKSTVPVGTGRKIIDRIKEINSDLNFSYVSNPEFLAEGSAIYDTFMMDRVVIGGDEDDALDVVLDIYRDINSSVDCFDLDSLDEFVFVYKEREKKKKNDKKKTIDFNVVKTSLESAELIKVTSNAFLSLKISFANSIALLCDKTGADINEVMDGVGLDKRIGRSFLYAGRGYGGGCFPKDVSGLISIADDNGVDLKIMRASTEVNDCMVDEIVKKIKKNTRVLKNKRVSLLGLSFKPGTSDVRKSPALKLARVFSENNCIINVFDPEAMEEAKRDIDFPVTFCSCIEDCLYNPDIIVVATEWPVFLNFDFEGFFKEKNKFLKKRIFFVDCQNRFDFKKKNLFFRYIGVGRGS